MKTKFKLTPQTHKAILKSANELPKLIKLNADGSHQYRKLSTFKGVTNQNTSLGTYTKNSTVYSEPVYVNHEVEMRNAFAKYGELGIEKYIEFVHEINNSKNKTQIEKANIIDKNE